MAGAASIALIGATKRFTQRGVPIPVDGGAFPSGGFRRGGDADAQDSFLSQVPLFAVLGEPERRKVAEACRTRSFRPREALFHEGDMGHALYVLRSGRVKIVIETPDGRETILAICGPTECVGDLSLLDGEPRCATVVALERVDVLVLYREDLLTLLQGCPPMALALLGRLAAMVRCLNKKVQDVMSLDTTSRTAKTLLELADRYGEATPEGVRIDLRLSQQDLAQMIGAARGRVNMCLSWFQERGILTVERERITVHELHELRKRVY